MSVLLKGEQGEMLINNHGWAALLRLAWDYGWRPRGTLPPRHWVTQSLRDRARDWPSADYVTGRGQRVTPIDATLLGDALAAVFEDLSNDDVPPDDSVQPFEMPGFPGLGYVSEGRRLHSFQMFGGSNRAGYRAFVRFCRAGPFEIW